MKRLNIDIKMRRRTRGLQILLRIHFNKNNKLIVCLQEYFHNVQNVSRLRHEHTPFSCSICNLFAISRQVSASMTSVTMVNAQVIRVFSSFKLETGVPKTLVLAKPKMKKSNGVMSGERGGHGVGPSLLIHLFGKALLGSDRDRYHTFLKCDSEQSFKLWR